MRAPRRSPGLIGQVKRAFGAPNAGVDVLGVEGVAEEHLLGECVGRALGYQQFHIAVGAGPLRVDDRLHQIMALTTEGLTLAGIRKVLELQR